MNTHDIELPPLLPHPRNQAAGKVWTEPEKEVIRRWGHAAIEADRKRRSEDQEPFGYFRPDSFGWTDCAATDEGAIALYERTQVRGEPVEIKAQPVSGADGLPSAARDVEIERLTNNRDMWRGQCERQAASITANSAEIARLRDALRDLVRDLEMRSNMKLGDDKGVVDCGHGVYMKAKRVLGEA